MEMCARKYMFGDESTFGSSQNGQNMPKKGQQEFFFCTLNKGQLLMYSSIRSLVMYMQIQRFKYVWEPFPHLKCENGSECGIGMSCPVLYSL